MKTILRTSLGLALCLCTYLNSEAQVILSTDFTSNTIKKSIIEDHFTVFNRINPVGSFKNPILPDAGISVVRPLGGIADEGVPDLSKDTYTWNPETKKFETDFSIIKTQLDQIKRQKFKVHQIVLDNPSWAFQRDDRGELIDGQTDYIVSTFGNAEPPRKNTAWANYLKEAMTFIVKELGGPEDAKNIQFGIGREIGTSGHWSGTQDEFFEFYRVSVEAIKSVLPNAKVGSHFLWGSSDNSWGRDFVDYCKEREVPYDFVGVSYYPVWNQASRTNFDEVYPDDFGVIKDNSNWNRNAELQIHEYSLIQGTGAAAGGSVINNAPNNYQNSFLIGLMKMFYENDMNDLALWNSGEIYNPIMEELINLTGDTYYANSKSGTPVNTKNFVNAIFTENEKNNSYKVLVSNYNAFIGSTVAEDLNVRAVVDVKPGTNYRYRIATYDIDNNTITKPEYKTAKTIGGSGGNTSTVSFKTTELPAFSFLIYEFEITGGSSAKAFTNAKETVTPLIAFPNPSTDGVFQLNRETAWEIYDLKGQQVLKGTSKTIDLASRSRGIYTLKAGENTLKLAF